MDENEVFMYRNIVTLFYAMPKELFENLFPVNLQSNIKDDFIALARTSTLTMLIAGLNSYITNTVNQDECILLHKEIIREIELKKNGKNGNFNIN